MTEWLDIPYFLRANYKGKMMTDIFLVVRREKQGANSIVGAFSTEEKAQGIVKRLGMDFLVDTWEINSEEIVDWWMEANK